MFYSEIKVRISNLSNSMRFAQLWQTLSRRKVDADNKYSISCKLQRMLLNESKNSIVSNGIKVGTCIVLQKFGNFPILWYWLAKNGSNDNKSV